MHISVKFRRIYAITCDYEQVSSNASRHQTDRTILTDIILAIFVGTGN